MCWKPWDENILGFVLRNDAGGPAPLLPTLHLGDWFSNLNVHQEYYLESLLKIQIPRPHSGNFDSISSGMWPKNMLLISFPEILEQWFADNSLKDPNCFRISVEIFLWLLLSEVAHFEFFKWKLSR